MAHMNKIGISVLTAAAFILSLAGCTGSANSASRESNHPTAGTERALGDETPWATFSTDSYSVFLTLDTAAKRVLLRGVEEDPATGTMYHWDKAFGVTYTPTAAAFRHGNEMYVAGTSSAAATIVERWDIPHVPGMYYSTLRTTPGGTIGVPLVTGTVDIAIEGGSFVDPALRAAPTVTRTIVYSGSGVGPIAGMEIEPDARFLLVTELSTEWRLVQIRLGPSPTVHVIATQTQFPDLVGASGARAADNSIAGRMYRLTTRDGGEIWVEDSTNDGILDAVNELDGRSFDTAFPAHTWSRVH